jgi:predicted nucleotidyltransferase
MDNTSSILKSFLLQDELNPKIWDFGVSDGGKPKMKSEIRNSLLEIAYEFIEFIGVEVFVEDIVMTGSLSNYNWSKYSDVDLHLIIDYKQFSEEQVTLYKELFNLKKIIFNTNHDIKIKNFDVELYAQDSSEAHFSTGEYSVLYDEWITEPKKESVKIDTEKIKHKAEQWMNIIDGVIENASDEDLDDAKELIKKYKEKLKKFRQCGLENGGEYSIENLVFKLLRRNGYIEKLMKYQDKLMDNKLSVENNIKY